MDSYFDLKALPNAEIIQSAVVAELVQVIHKYVPAYGGRIGLAFPAYGQQKTLGGIVRLVGNHQDITDMHASLIQSPVVQDYALTTRVAAVPDGVQKFVCYQRKHARGNSRFQRLKKRHQARGTWTDALEQAALDKTSRNLFIPHLALKSASTGQTFMLFVERQHSSVEVPGEFNGYGLGLNGATLPDF